MFISDLYIYIFFFFFKQAAVKYYNEPDQQYKEYNLPVNNILLKLDESFMVSHEKNEETNRWKVTVDQKEVSVTV